MKVMCQVTPQNTDIILNSLRQPATRYVSCSNTKPNTAVKTDPTVCTIPKE